MIQLMSIIFAGFIYVICSKNSEKRFCKNFVGKHFNRQGIHEVILVLKKNPMLLPHLLLTADDRQFELLFTIHETSSVAKCLGSRVNNTSLPQMFFKIGFLKNLLDFTGAFLKKLRKISHRFYRKPTVAASVLSVMISP